MRIVVQTLTDDAWNRLVQVKSGGTTFVTYAYDGQNWRTTKAYGGYVWDYYYTSAWQVIEEERTADDTTYPWLQNVWGLLGPDNLVLRDRPDERLYAFSNSLGSISAIVNASGTVQERYGYNAFGTPLFMNVEWFVTGYSSFDWVTLFAGYLYDVEDQSYQPRNRFLHPALGRWLSRDPIGYKGGLNFYAYVGNAPINQVDPSGLGAWKVQPLSNTYINPNGGSLLDPNSNGFEVIFMPSQQDYDNEKTYCGQIVLYQIIDHHNYDYSNNPSPILDGGYDKTCPNLPAPQKLLSSYTNYNASKNPYPYAYADSPTLPPDPNAVLATYQITAVAVIRVPSLNGKPCYDIPLGTYFFQFGNASRVVIQNNNNMTYIQPNNSLFGEVGTDFAGEYMQAMF